MITLGAVCNTRSAKYSHFKESHDKVKLISVLCVVCLIVHGVLFVKYRMSSIMFRTVEGNGSSIVNGVTFRFTQPVGRKAPQRKINAEGVTNDTTKLIVLFIGYRDQVLVTTMV